MQKFKVTKMFMYGIITYIITTFSPTAEMPGQVISKK